MTRAEVDCLIKKIECYLSYHNAGLFFHSSVKELVEQLGITCARHHVLIDWIDTRLKSSEVYTCLSPVNLGSCECTDDILDSYKETITDIAMLLSFKTALLSPACDEIQFNNVERCIQKLYSVSYNENLDYYI